MGKETLPELYFICSFFYLFCSFLVFFQKEESLIVLLYDELVSLMVHPIGRFIKSELESC